MKLFLATSYIIIGLSAYGWLIEGNPNFLPLWFLFLLLSSVFLFNEGGIQRLLGQSEQQYLQKCLHKGTAVKEHYFARQAITFEDQHIGCLCHLILLDTGEILCLYNQTLYLYAEVSDDGDNNQIRRFPTRQFSLIKKTKNQEIMTLNIGDTVIEEIKINNPNLTALKQYAIELKDGNIIQSIDFELLLNILTME